MDDTDGMGFDDQFNEGLFKNSLSSSTLKRPHMWPKSTSEMRVHTSYQGQDLAKGDYRNTAMSDYTSGKPVNPAGPIWQYAPPQGSWAKRY